MGKQANLVVWARGRQDPPTALPHTRCRSSSLHCAWRRQQLGVAFIRWRQTPPRGSGGTNERPPIASGIVSLPKAVAVRPPLFFISPSTFEYVLPLVSIGIA